MKTCVRAVTTAGKDSRHLRCFCWSVWAGSTTWPHKGTAAYGRQEIQGIITLSTLQEGYNSHFGSHLSLFAGKTELLPLDSGPEDPVASLDQGTVSAVLWPRKSE